MYLYEKLFITLLSSLNLLYNVVKNLITFWWLAR